MKVNGCEYCRSNAVHTWLAMTSYPDVSGEIRTCDAPVCTSRADAVASSLATWPPLEP